MRRAEQRRLAVFALYQNDLTGRPLLELLERGTPPYARELVAGADAARARLDAIIAAHAHNWDVERIAPLERNILRVALYELTERDDVPDEVAIDEAIELAKRYCAADTAGFVNGILGSVLRELRASSRT